MRCVLGIFYEFCLVAALSDDAVMGLMGWCALSSTAVSGALTVFGGDQLRSTPPPLPRNNLPGRLSITFLPAPMSQTSIVLVRTCKRSVASQSMLLVRVSVSERK